MLTLLDCLLGFNEWICSESVGSFHGVSERLHRSDWRPHRNRSWWRVHLQVSLTAAGLQFFADGLLHSMHVSFWVCSKLYGDQARFFDAEKVPRIKHKKKGTVSMVNNGNDQHGSQVRWMS